MKQINGYYINNLPKNSFGKNYMDYDLAKSNTKLFLKKNIHDINVISQLRMWFDDLKQPTKKQVQNAMILIIDEDYSLKSGGESASDNIYSSSLKWMQAHPKTGLDYEPVIIKKWSTNFEDVLITFKDIEELWNQTITPEEKNEEETDNIIGALGMLMHNYRTNNHTNKNHRTDWIIPYLKKFDTKRVLKELDIIYNKRKKECEEYISSGNGILGDDFKTICPIKTEKYISDMKKNIEVCETIKLIINV